MCVYVSQIQKSNILYNEIKYSSGCHNHKQQHISSDRNMKMVHIPKWNMFHVYCLLYTDPMSLNLFCQQSQKENLFPSFKDLLC